MCSKRREEVGERGANITDLLEGAGSTGVRGSGAGGVMGVIGGLGVSVPRPSIADSLALLLSEDALNSNERKGIKSGRTRPVINMISLKWREFMSREIRLLKIPCRSWRWHHIWYWYGVRRLTKTHIVTWSG